MHERRYHAPVERLRSPQRVRLLEVERVIDLCLDGLVVRHVLDIGTGSGIFAEGFFRKGISVSGIDPDTAMVTMAKQFVPAGNFIQGTVEKIPFGNNAFDLVFLGHVLHESDDLLKALSESQRCAAQRVAILEWPYRREENGPPLEHRLKPEEVLAAAAPLNFSRVETIPLSHMVLFRLTR